MPCADLVPPTLYEGYGWWWPAPAAGCRHQQVTGAIEELVTDDAGFVLPPGMFPR
jgi:hypothetical protein